jgi:hypothetical protein
MGHDWYTIYTICGTGRVYTTKNISDIKANSYIFNKKVLFACDTGYRGDIDRDSISSVYNLLAGEEYVVVEFDSLYMESQLSACGPYEIDTYPLSIKIDDTRVMVMSTCSLTPT